MKPSTHEEGKRWLAQAERDLDAAGLLSNGKHYNLACFHAQQSAEKAAKGFLYAQGVEEPWGHSVARLLDEAASFDETLGALTTTGALLDKFYIPTRYPNGLPDGIPSAAYSKEEARDAAKKAREIIRAVSLRLESSSGKALPRRA